MNALANTQQQALMQAQGDQQNMAHLEGVDWNGLSAQSAFASAERMADYLQGMGYELFQPFEDGVGWKGILAQSASAQSVSASPQSVVQAAMQGGQQAAPDSPVERIEKAISDITAGRVAPKKVAEVREACDKITRDRAVGQSIGRRVAWGLAELATSQK